MDKTINLVYNVLKQHKNIFNHSFFLLSYRAIVAD